MSKHKILASPKVAAERGLNAFHGGRFAEAIAVWEPLAKTEPRIARALAEVYFRRALSRKATPEQQLQDLQRAADLAPNDATYQYHLGLTYHRAGDLATALVAYEFTQQAGPIPRGLPFVRALALAETDPQADLSAQVGLSQKQQAQVAALAAFLRGDASPSMSSSQRQSLWGVLVARLGGPDPLDMLWRGMLALLASDETVARESLSASVAKLPPTANALRSYYLGVMAARQNDFASAQVQWQQAQTHGMAAPWLRENLAAIRLQKGIADAQAERWSDAAESARAMLQVDAQNLAAVELALVALDRLAHAAVAQDDWATASRNWVEAKTIHAQSGSKTASRIILKNLAIAFEPQEQWEQAGETWRELLRSRPRAKKARSEYSDAQWEWISKRAAEVFKQADRPDATIDFLKKAVKSNPGDIAQRLELADALLANDQLIAARNQLQSARELDPRHTPTLLKLAEYHTQRSEWFSAEQVMREALIQEPQNESLRQHMAQLLVRRGSSAHLNHMDDVARKAYQEALTYTPNDPDIYINIARVELDTRHVKAAEKRLEQAVTLNPRRIESHMQIVTCWAIERDIPKVRAALAQAETDAQLDTRFYLATALACLEAARPPQSALLGFPGAPRASAKQTADPAWENLADELFGRALALKPDDLELLRSILNAAVETSQPKLGLRYADRLLKLAPDDPEVFLSLGLLHGQNGRVDEAKKMLKQAARLARQQGNDELEQTANDLRREVGNPFLAQMLSNPALRPLAGFPEDEDDFLDDIFAPLRRRK